MFTWRRRRLYRDTRFRLRQIRIVARTAQCYLSRLDHCVAVLWRTISSVKQFFSIFIQWPTLLYCSYFSERLWSSNSVRPCASVFNFIFLVLIGFILVLRVVALISISHSYGWMAGCLSPVFMFPPIFIIFSSYFIYFKSSV